MTMPEERLRHLADTKRGIDDPQDIGYYESCALAEECLALRARVAELEADAARYRFLRARDPKRDLCLHCGYDGLVLSVGDELDAVIDAARLSGNKTEVLK